ncbi:MAG TPA: ATP-binding protein, partial [Balneolales bacterium]|nr:ATP-binding protein [Balneolales bacterium]
IEAMNITIEMDLEDNPKVKASRELINAMFYNLIQNAIKFSAEDTTIKVKGEWLKDQQQYQLQVIDQGKGISAELLPVVFDRFKKPDSKWNDSPGLGLSIVKSICDLHDFKADIKSEKSKGTTVTITIPVASIIST